MRKSRAAFVLVGLYLAVVFFGRLPDNLILFPSTAAIDTHGAVRKAIPFENGQLELWTAKSRPAQQNGRPDVYVLRFYGNADRAERWVSAEADSWNDRAIEIWGMNYPGFGGSTGPAKLSRVGPAALTAFDELKRSVDKKSVVLFGASLGTTAALHVSLQIPKELDSVANSKTIHAPAIFLLAEKDEVVAPRYQHLVVNAYAGEKRIITLRGANHNTPIEGVAVADLYKALDWLLPRREIR